MMISSSFLDTNSRSTPGFHASTFNKSRIVPTRRYAHIVSNHILARSLRLAIGAANIPHPEKASYGGEDAFFVSTVGGGVIGVADGVGGWQESGINPAEYSRDFMQTSLDYFEQSLDEDIDQLPEGPLNALKALEVAHKRTLKPGSATACIIRLDKASYELDVANLGDSGFVLIRNGQIVFKSEHQQHFFDCPYQFGATPDATDTVDDADSYKVPVQVGDVVILATDGVLDNVWPDEMLEFAPSSPENVKISAKALAQRASEHALDPNFESPYSVEASQEGIELNFWDKIKKASFDNGKLELGKLSGGKLDDITVIVAYVEQGEEELTSSGDGNGGVSTIDY